MTMKLFAIRLDDNTRERLDRLARATGRTKTFYVRQALSRYLDDMEDLYLAEQRYIDLKTGHTTTVSLDDLERNIELDD